VVFRTLILRLNLKTPGREESEIKLYSKADYQAARGKTSAAGRRDQTGPGRWLPAGARRRRQYRKHQQLRHPTAHRAGRYGENAKRRRL
jgi:hypothetical protein